MDRIPCGNIMQPQGILFTDKRPWFIQPYQRGISIHTQDFQSTFEPFLAFEIPKLTGKRCHKVTRGNCTAFLGSGTRFCFCRLNHPIKWSTPPSISIHLDFPLVNRVPIIRSGRRVRFQRKVFLLLGLFLRQCRQCLVKFHPRLVHRHLRSTQETVLFQLSQCFCIELNLPPSIQQALQADGILHGPFF